MRVLRTGLIWLLTLLYPLVIYLGIGKFEPRWLALFLLILAGGRALVSRDRIWQVAAAGAAVLVVFSFLANHALPLKLYPVLVSLVMLALFAYSLLFPPSVIERLARLRDPQLPAFAIAYTRRVTQVWCVFFLINAAIGLGTALYASDGVWALYNGFIAYVLMGLLFVGEWLVRRRVRRAAGHG
ncbi:hypothetical protein [Arenimonas sp.]|uniref:COG4648 family protein n=1 Tax=Arenimonas sp. TaxID=1872635 RepID=UPI0039E50D99